MNRLSMLNATTIVVPILCLLFAAGITGYQYYRLRTLDERSRQTEQQIATVERQLNEMAAQPAISHVPAEQATPQEQPAFLNILRSCAELHHVRLVRWSNSAASPAAEPAGSALPAGVTAVSSALQVEGTYSDVRAFLYELMRARRLYTTSDVKWSRDTTWPLTRLDITLTRYVTSAALAAPAS